ncbi:hypothetical protein [Pseudactinotalea terrae]|uniref:hypothetical protein n=1 Tax=Pseudactinotalea terrae TaxID=1743262 RepID=UPI0012E15FFD|nr:hypothetical protein [Pseudactinotalea terrae]
MRSLDLRSEVAWRGAVEVVDLGGTITPWRLPPARRDCFDAADLVTLCLGINVHGAATHSRRSLRPAVLGFLATVCDGHPDVPVQVISPLPTLRSADETNLHGLTLGEVRDAVEPSVQILRADGATQLELVPGPAIFDPTEPGVMHDRIHPSEVGYARIAERMTPYLSAAKEA